MLHYPQNALTGSGALLGGGSGNIWNSPPEQTRPKKHPRTGERVDENAIWRRPKDCFSLSTNVTGRAKTSNKGKVNKSPAPIFVMFSCIILLAIKKIGAGRLRRWTLQAFPLPRYAPAGWIFAIKFCGSSLGENHAAE
jgi:hypothetical protein